jgi:hypothetical protein
MCASWVRDTGIVSKETRRSLPKRIEESGEINIMQGNLSAIVFLTEIVSILILSGAVGLILLKLRNLRIERLSTKYTQKHQEYFDYIVANLEDDLPFNIPYGTIQPLEMKIIQQKLFAWMGQIRGEQRAKIVDLCHQLGFVDRENARLHSKLRWIQIDAAYNLGVMRYPYSNPKLLELLAGEKFGSPLFIISRAIARCARDVSEIRSMMQLIVEHQKSCSELMADILLDVNIDYSSLLLEWLQSEEQENVKIALLCLHGQTILKVDTLDEAVISDEHYSDVNI